MLGRQTARGLSLAGSRLGRSASSSSSSLSLDQQLSAFPEFVLAETEMSKGQFKRALPGMQRVQEVVSSALGPASPSAVHTLLRMARLHQLLGDFRQGEQVLKVANVQGQELVKILHATSLLRLMSGSASGALEAAAKSLEICEQSSDNGQEATVSTGMFSPSHSLLGLAHLHLGDVELAETHLQLAARWAESLPTQLAALNNLGVLYWTYGKTQDSSAGPVSIRSDRRVDLISSKSLWRKTATIDKEGGGSVEEKREILWSKSSATEALLYWQDAILEAARSDASTMKSSAGSMCAPPSSVDPLGPGMTATIVPPSPQSESMKSNDVKTQTPQESPDTILASRLGEVAFACTYATLLCNSAEAHEALGEAARATELMLSALKALEPHMNALESHPALGRVLSLIAFGHMSASRAVTAEGLFRSAIDKLQSPYGKHDLRYLYEHAVTKGGFGVLLSKWDRRKEEGRAMLESSTLLLKELHPASGPAQAVLVNPSLIYPCLPF